jgi:molybdate transport system substrate-binding protein
MRIGRLAVLVTVWAVGCSLLLAQKSPSTGTALRVLSSNGVKPAVEELIPQMERSAGREIKVQFNSTQKLREMIEAGEPFDVVILTVEGIDDLIRKGRITAGTRTDIGRVGIGIGVRAGAAKPDLRTPEALKQAFLRAKSISLNPIGASAAHFNRILDRLGIAEAVKPKLIEDSVSGRPQRNVAEGKAELVFTLIPEIRYFPGVELAGPLPSVLQNYTNFAAGVAANTTNAELARALIKLMISPEGVSVLESKDVEPH